MNFKTAASLLLLSNLVVADQVDENCSPIEQLGTPNLDRYDYSISMVSNTFLPSLEFGSEDFNGRSCFQLAHTLIIFALFRKSMMLVDMM